jgi:hypothetical protein
MADLLKINGRKINFSGFGWDYGGYIISYNGGALDNSNVNFRMDLVSGADEGLVGDTEVNTDMPSVKKVLDSIRIWQISLNFNRGN